MADIPINITVNEPNLDTTINSFKQLKQSLRDAINELATLEEGTDAYIAQAQRVGSIRDQVNSLNDAIRNTSGAPVENLTNSFGLLSGQIRTLDFDGATTSLRQFSTGVSSLSFKSLIEGGKSFVSTLGTLGKALLSNPIFLVSTIIIGIGAAIFALKDKVKVVGLAFDALGDVMNSIIEAGEAIISFIGGPLAKAAIATHKQIEATKELLQAQIDTAKKTGEAIEERYDREIKLAQVSNKDVTLLEKEKAISIRKNIDNEILAITKLGQLKGKLTDEEKARLDELNKLRRASLLDEEVASIKHYNDLVKRIQEAQNKQAEERQKANEAAAKANEEILKNNLALNKEIENNNVNLIKDDYERNVAKAKLDAKRKIEEINNIKASESIKKQAIISAETALQEELDKLKVENDAKIKSQNEAKIAEDLKLQEEYNAKIRENNLKVNEQALNDLKAFNELKVLQASNDSTALLAAQLSQNDTLKQIELSNTELTENEKALIIEKYRQSDLELEKNYLNAKRDMQIGIASDVINSIQAISDIAFLIKNNQDSKSAEQQEKNAKKQFQINKALQLGNAIIDGYKAVTASLSQSPVAIGPVPNPAGIASLAFAATTSSLNIAKIAATQYKSSGSSSNSNTSTSNIGGGGGTPQTGEKITPQLSNIQSTAFNQNNVGNNSNNGQQNNIRVYVTEHDITSTQKKVALTENLATI
jgi:type VI protein secretion system component Hcp